MIYCTSESVEHYYDKNRIQNQYEESLNSYEFMTKHGLSPILFDLYAEC
jgi:hypothetical protein